MQEFTKPRASTSQAKDAGNSSNASEIRSSDHANTTQIKNVEDDSSVPLSQSCTINEKLLGGMIEDLYFLIFIFLCFEKQIKGLCVSIYVAV